MAFPWYKIVPADTPLDQGDIILDCLVAGWKDSPIQTTTIEKGDVILKDAVEIAKMDVVVMTQTCDLAEEKVEHIVLCPHYPLETFREEWEKTQKANDQKPTDRSWGKFLDRIVKAQVWNLAILNKEDGEDYTTNIRIVDFHEIFSLPLDFLKSWLAKENSPRLRLLPPYREHLSQAFARFFMRVGLPTDIQRCW
jgi:hypothetical protein